jgi:alkaline phosphatase D
MRIAFASCIKAQDVPNQDIWEEIQNLSPDVFLLLGDNVYIDAGFHPGSATDVRGELQARYQVQTNEPHFKALLEKLSSQGKRVSAIWDDHDFLGNDTVGGNVALDIKSASRDCFHQAMPYSNNKPEVYHSFDIGLARFIMLDVRFYRFAKESQGTTNDILGDTQLSWLKAQLAHPLPYTIVCSGTTFYKYPGLQSECWTKFPRARNQVLDLLAGRSGVLYLSGDIHSNEIGDADGLVEVVSSGAARHSLNPFGGKLRNYGYIDLHEAAAEIHLRGNKAKECRDITLQLNAWHVS